MNNLSDISNASEQAMSIKYNTKVYELKQQGIDVLTMSLGEAFFDIPLFSFNDLKKPDLYHYSHSRGIINLRKKLSTFFLKNYNFSFDAEKEIIVTAGSKAAIHMTFMSIINPGDEVIIPEPFWVSYPEEVKLCYGVPISVPINKTVFDFENYITEKTKAIIITNPHNPTGYVYTKKELKYLLDLAQKHNLWLLSDEAYSEFVNDNSFNSLGNIDKTKENSIIFNSISKNYGISGWRLGYVISNKELIFNVLKINQHLITCPSTILELYIEKYFDDILQITESQIYEVVEKRNRIAHYLDRIGLDYIKGNATFYLFVSISPSKLSSEEFCDILLDKYYICVVPGIGYGRSCDKYIRVSIGTANEEEIQLGLKKIKELIEKTQ